MTKEEAYIRAWVAENIEHFRGIASSDFNEKYKADLIFIEAVVKLVEEILATKNYQLMVMEKEGKNDV